MGGPRARNCANQRATHSTGPWGNTAGNASSETECELARVTASPWLSWSKKRQSAASSWLEKSRSQAERPSTSPLSGAGCALTWTCCACTTCTALCHKPKLCAHKRASSINPASALRADCGAGDASETLFGCKRMETWKLCLVRQAYFTATASLMR